MASLRGMGILGFLGHAPSNDEWTVLNPDLMEMLHCTYKGSYILQTLLNKLTRETLKGGVSIKHLGGKSDTAASSNAPLSSSSPSPYSSFDTQSQARSALGRGTTKKKARSAKGKAAKTRGVSSSPDGSAVQDLSPGEHACLLTTLKRATRYGLLFGLVPVMLDPKRPGSLRIPPVKSGRFVARMDAHGTIDVGWQWRERGIGGDSAAPDRDVWVFVWDDRYPDVGSSAPFDSVLQPLLPELLREQELVETDTQANYELNCPPFVLQENPRTDRDASERQILDLYMPDYLMDPSGRMPGHGPGGTLTGVQRSLLRSDVSGSLRASRSRQRGDQGFAGDALRIRIDPCSGEISRSFRTLVWQRGAYTTPAGWTPTTGFARPVLRGDLLAQRGYVTHMVAASMGVPTLMAFGGIDPGSGGSTGGSGGSGGKRSDSGVHSTTLQQSAACENMRETVWAVRNELGAFYAQAHFQLMWMREAVGLSRDVALGEQLIQEDTEATEAMARQLELVGVTIREEMIKKRDRRLRQTLALHRAAELFKEAKQHWRGELIRQRVESLETLLSGSADVSAARVVAADRRGRNLRPADPQLLRDPEDIEGDVTDLPRSARWIEESRSIIDPNLLAATVDDRRQRNEDEGRHVAGVTLLPRGDQSGQSGYQARTLTEELPDLSKSIERARDMMDARIRQVEETERKRARLTPASGERGETKIELVWRTPPVPDWPVLRELALDDVLDPRMFQRMLLADLGFDPATAAPKGVKPFARQREEAKAKNQPKPAAAAPAPKRKAEPSGGGEKKKKKKTPEPAPKKAKKNPGASKGGGKEKEKKRKRSEKEDADDKKRGEKEDDEDKDDKDKRKKKKRKTAGKGGASKSK